MFGIFRIFNFSISVKAFAFFSGFDMLDSLVVLSCCVILSLFTEH